MRSTYTLMFSVSLRSGHGFSRVVSAARAAGGSAGAGETGEGEPGEVAAVWGEVTDPACHRLGRSAALGRRLGDVCDSLAPAHARRPER